MVITRHLKGSCGSSPAATMTAARTARSRSVGVASTDVNIMSFQVMLTYKVLSVRPSDIVSHFSRALVHKLLSCVDLGANTSAFKEHIYLHIARGRRVRVSLLLSLFDRSQTCPMVSQSVSQ